MGKAEDDAKREEDAAAAEAALEERIGKAIDARLNKAISGHLTRMTPKLAETIGAQVLAGIKAAQGGDEDTDDAGAAGVGAGKGKVDKDNPLAQQLATMQKRLETETKKREDSERKQVESESRRARAEEDDAVKSALMASGVKDEARIRAALHTHRGEGRIKRDEAGTILFIKRTDSGDEEVPLAKGIAEWSKTDEGKVFLPPSGASGSGGNAPKNGAGATKGTKLSTTDFQNSILAAVTGDGQG